MLDIVFCSLPYSNLDHIYSAPAILKGVAVTNGYTAKTVDFGCALLNQLQRDENKFRQTQLYFISQSDGKEEYKQEIDTFYKNCLDFFKKNPSKYIGLSALSIFTHKAVYELCSLIKKEKIKSQIVIGGRGAKVSTFFSVTNNYELTGQEKLIPFGSLLQKKGLADHVIIGDGEDAILELLSSNKVQDTYFISEEFKSPVPDYDDYNFNDYLFNDEPMLPVTGSKGCVRDCDFCDVKFQFGKYRYRSGADIANEMIAVSAKFGIRKFQFTDSLVNGGLKPFREFLEVLSKFNLDNPDKKITWNGQYICRPEKEMPKDLYPLMKASGAHGLTIGAESGSNNVLKAMNKKTTVEALYAELENFRKNNLTCVLLTFVGHWSETFDDFQEHCKMLINITPYVRSGTVSAISLGYSFAILDGTPSMFNHEFNNIELNQTYKENFWLNKDNPTNTFKERLYRRLMVHRLARQLQIPTISDREIILQLTDIVNNSYNEINEFYQKFS